MTPVDLSLSAGGLPPHSCSTKSALRRTLNQSILETVKTLTERGTITLVSTTDGTYLSAAGRANGIGVLASIAEFEREMVKELPALKL